MWKDPASNSCHSLLSWRPLTGMNQVLSLVSGHLFFVIRSEFLNDDLKYSRLVVYHSLSLNSSPANSLHEFRFTKIKM